MKYIDDIESGKIERCKELTIQEQAELYRTELIKESNSLDKNQTRSVSSNAPTGKQRSRSTSSSSSSSSSSDRNRTKKRRSESPSRVRSSSYNHRYDYGNNKSKRKPRN